MKITVEELKKIILEQTQDENMPVNMNNATAKVRLALDSVDDQIDSHMIDFEASTLVAPEDLVMESLSSLRLSVLLEQDEGLEGDDPGVDPPEGSEDVSVEEPIEPAKKPAMNIDSFTKKVAQLALGYQARLDIPTVIINRAINFLNENYDKSYTDEFKNILDTQFDFNIAPVRDTGAPPAGGREPGLGAFGESEGLPEKASS
jgi:acyl carrier protein